MSDPKILTVDDSKTIRLLLARILRPFAVEVCEASNGEEGLAVAAEKGPQLIILDYNMPVMDGLTMLSRLRESADLKATPVIMLTAESGSAIISAVARLGARDYIVKPFEEQVLLSKINKILPLMPRGATVDPTP
jgi:two-component system cell cycle response regulator